MPQPQGQTFILKKNVANHLVSPSAGMCQTKFTLNLKTIIAAVDDPSTSKPQSVHPPIEK